MQRFFFRERGKRTWRRGLVRDVCTSTISRECTARSAYDMFFAADSSCSLPQAVMCDKNEKCKGIISDSSIFGWNEWIWDSASREMLRKMIQSEFQNSVQTDILIDKYQHTCCWIVEIGWVVVEKMWEIDEVFRCVYNEFIMIRLGCPWKTWTYRQTECVLLDFQ